MKDERTLVEGCRQRDRVAQRTLYERFAARLFAVCQRYTKNRTEAEDVLQEAFIKVFAQIDTFRFESPLEAWLKKIVINTALSYLRHEKQYFNQTDVENFTDSSISTDDPMSNMQYEQLIGLIRKLPSGCQAVFNLYVVEGYQHAEIASMLGISEGTSKSQLARAKQLLQAKILENS